MKVNYTPLFTVVLLTTLTASAKQAQYRVGWNTVLWMHDFMGFFLVIFAMLKFFDLRGFVTSFKKYDLLAKRFEFYGYCYPVIELALGLGYLAQWHVKETYFCTLVVMSFGACGVLHALRHGLNVQCACMGSVLRVPLSTVALVEDLGMAAMAFFMLVTKWT